jgi:hypothetical protein
LSAWQLTPEAAAFQQAYVATLVAAGTWTGPEPSPWVLAEAAALSTQAAFGLAA